MDDNVELGYINLNAATWKFLSILCAFYQKILFFLFLTQI